MTDLLAYYRSLQALDQIALLVTAAAVLVLGIGALWLVGPALWIGVGDVTDRVRRHLIQREIDAWTRTYCPACGDYDLRLRTNRCRGCHGPLEHVSSEDFPAHVARTWKDPAVKGFKHPPPINVDQHRADRATALKTMQDQLNTRRPS